MWRSTDLHEPLGSKLQSSACQQGGPGTCSDFGSSIAKPEVRSSRFFFIVFRLQVSASSRNYPEFIIWLVVWNIFVFPRNIGLRLSSQLTNSIIFQRGGPGPPTSYSSQPVSSVSCSSFPRTAPLRCAAALSQCLEFAVHLTPQLESSVEWGPVAWNSCETYGVWYVKYIYIYGGVLKWGYPQIIHFHGIFHYKPTIFWDPPFMETFIYI